MKTRIKWIKTILVLVLLAGLTWPGTVAAVQLGGSGQPGINPNGKGIGGGNFCTKVSNIKIDQQIADKVSRLQSNYQNRLTATTQKRTNQENKLEERRDKWDANRDKRYTRLNKLATTPEEKAAVAKFIAAIESAVKVRRTAMDTALTTFKRGVDTAIATRRSGVITATNNYYQAVKVALDKAKTNCSKTEADSTAIRNVFVKALETAKTKLQTEKTAVDKLGEKIAALTTTKTTAITKAVNDFKAAVEAARVDLLKILPSA